MLTLLLRHKSQRQGGRQLYQPTAVAVGMSSYSGALLRHKSHVELMKLVIHSLS